MGGCLSAEPQARDLGAAAPVPLDEDARGSSPHEAECPVCLESGQGRAAVRLPCCGACFCGECLDCWSLAQAQHQAQQQQAHPGMSRAATDPPPPRLPRSLTCPMCRAPLVLAGWPAAAAARKPAASLPSLPAAVALSGGGLPALAQYLSALTEMRAAALPTGSSPPPTTAEILFAMACLRLWSECAPQPLGDDGDDPRR